MPVGIASAAMSRFPQTPRMSMTGHARTPTTDIRKRMDDVYNEIDQNSRGGRLRMPLKFVDFHQTDVMYQFTRAAVGYALSYVKVKTLEKENNERASAEELAKFHASQMLNQYNHEPVADADVSPEQQRHEREAWQLNLQQAVDSQSACATLLAETYARVVLHCSNFEHHKEDERFFECVYFFICSVVKVGLAPEHWIAVEDELAFLFRGAQFSATIKLHTSSKTHREQAAAAAAAAVQANEAAAKKLQSLSATGGVSGKDNAGLQSGDLTPFVLPTSAPTKCCYFSASLAVGKIVSELDAAKVRATRNIEVSQSIRDRIRQSREDEQQRRQLSAITSPRASVRLDFLQASHRNIPEVNGSRPSSPSSMLNQPAQPRRPHASGAGVGSPRLSMKATFTSRSPAVNHLLPGTEDRVRLALQEYERDFQRKLAEQRQQQRQLAASATHSDLSSSVSSLASVGSPQHTPTKVTQQHFR